VKLAGGRHRLARGGEDGFQRAGLMGVIDDHGCAAQGADGFHPSRNRLQLADRAERAAVAIEANRFDLIAIGRPLIANPDYLTKVKKGEALVPYADTMLAELV
jgi:2,4-dienoyl-CoA reductase-like NADH-dependent reductase (Old Yellow Enzyme family)